MRSLTTKQAGKKRAKARWCNCGAQKIFFPLHRKTKIRSDGSSYVVYGRWRCPECRARANKKWIRTHPAQWSRIVASYRRKPDVRESENKRYRLRYKTDPSFRRIKNLSSNRWRQKYPERYRALQRKYIQELSPTYLRRALIASGAKKPTEKQIALKRQALAVRRSSRFFQLMAGLSNLKKTKKR